MGFEPDDLLVVFVTCASDLEARRLADGLIAGRMAACANIADIDSLFRWKGKVHSQSEVLVIIKTVKSKFNEIEKFIKANHSYECPEIIGLKVEESSKDYADWIRSECGLIEKG